MKSIILNFIAGVLLIGLVIISNLEAAEAKTIGAGVMLPTSLYAGVVGLDPEISRWPGFTWSTSHVPCDELNPFEQNPVASDWYRFKTFSSDLATIRWHAAALVAGIGVVGIVIWDWGDSGYNLNNEGFFGSDTGSGGMDKLGHTYSTYLIADYFNHFMQANGASSNAPYNAALMAWGVMLGVEIFDGFSSDHGSSYEDLIFNFCGASFSVLRNTVPGLREKLDFRLEYLPSGNKDGFHPIIDYSGQKYVLALKLAGFDWFKETPLRFLELQGGYFARGFTAAEKERGEPKRQEPYVAIGLNVSELLFGSTKIGKTTFGRYAARFLEYVQVPYTYVATEDDK